MRIAFLVSMLLLATLSAAADQVHRSVVSSAGSSISYSIKNSQTRFDIRDLTGKSYVVWVKRDTHVSPKAEPTGVAVIGEIKGSAIILVDTYPSIPGGMSYCQAGEEQFLRVVSIAKKLAKETFQMKAASCRDNIELASPGIEWLQESSTLRIQWLLGPTLKGEPENRVIRIKPDGETN